MSASQPHLRNYDRLAAADVSGSIDVLVTRIEGRFPSRGLTSVARELRKLVGQVTETNEPAIRQVRLARVVSRAVMIVIVVAAVVAFGVLLRDAFRDDSVERSIDWIPLFESAVNDLIFAALAVFFLWSVPERLYRARLLALLHRLRSFAHVVDMHQLTKDPERLRPDFVPNRALPVELNLDFEEMEHYLSYCSEMLSLIGKASALVAEESRDAVVLDTVGSIEILTTNLSTKIWQKISVLGTIRDV